MAKSINPLDVVDASAETIRKIKKYFAELKMYSVTDDNEANEKNADLLDYECNEVTKIVSEGFKRLI